MTGTATAIGDNCCGAFHHRFPVRVGHVRDQNVARLHPFHFGRIHDDAHRARTDFLADRATGGQYGDVVGIGFECIALFCFAFGLAFHGFRTRLQDVDFAIATVFTPFDVHWATVVFFDNHGVFGQFAYVFVADRVAVACFERHIHSFHATFFACLGEFHFDQFRAHGAADDRGFALRQGWLEYIKLVGIDRALHHRFTQTVAGGDEYDLVKAGLGVHGEHHAGGSQIGAHHALYTGGQSDLGVGEAFVYAVGDGAVVVQRGKYVLDFVQYVVNARYIQIAFLLTGKGCVWQVFSGSG